MTIKELITQLEAYNPNRDVIIGIDIGNGGIEYIRPVSSLDDDGAFVTIIGE